jgi:hypothetical protein
MSLETGLKRLELAADGRPDQTPFILQDFSKMTPIEALAHFDAFRAANASGRQIVSDDQNAGSSFCQQRALDY